MQKSNYTYNILISRIDEEGSQDILIDQDISADQAIEEVLRLKVTCSEEDETEQEEETSASDEQEEEEEEPEPEKPKRGPRAVWDKERAKELINAGKKAGEIADEVGASVGSIYQLKTDMKKAGELNLPEGKVDRDPLTPKTKQPGHSKEDHEKKMQAMFRRLPEDQKEVVRQCQAGCDRSELLQMFPSIETYRIDDLISAYGEIDIS
jgi:hypothetical protein